MIRKKVKSGYDSGMVSALFFVAAKTAHGPRESRGKAFPLPDCRKPVIRDYGM